MTVETETVEIAESETEVQQETVQEENRPSPIESEKVIDLAMEVYRLQKSRASVSQILKKKRNRAKSKVARKSRAKNRRG